MTRKNFLIAITIAVGVGNLMIIKQTNTDTLLVLAGVLIVYLVLPILVWVTTNDQTKSDEVYYLKPCTTEDSIENCYFDAGETGTNFVVLNGNIVYVDDTGRVINVEPIPQHELN